MIKMIKNLPANAGDARDSGSVPGTWIGKIPWRRAWQLTFLHRKFHGQRTGSKLGREYDKTVYCHSAY